LNKGTSNNSKNKTKSGVVKSGAVAFVGEPNVGKSSLLNALVGERVSIATPTAGTTRECVRGFLADDATPPKWQITFLDTPGMDNRGRARDALDKIMAKNISAGVAECDVICYVLDAGDIRPEYIQKIQNLKSKRKIIVAVNKVDRSSYEKLYPCLAMLNPLDLTVVPVSAKDKTNLDVLVREIAAMLPERPVSEIADPDLYTDQSVNKMCAEIIRGELILRLRDEVPHGIAVQISDWREKGNEIEIGAQIVCLKSNHKPIIIGKNGAVLKAVGIAARKKIEELTQKHVRLLTKVFVRDNWRDKDTAKYLDN
jgi:GTP-binding protein Era